MGQSYKRTSVQRCREEVISKSPPGTKSASAGAGLGTTYIPVARADFSMAPSYVINIEGGPFILQGVTNSSKTTYFLLLLLIIAAAVIVMIITMVSPSVPKLLL